MRTKRCGKVFGQEEDGEDDEEGSYEAGGALWPSRAVERVAVLQFIPGLFHHKVVQALQVPGVVALVAPDAGSVDDEGGVAVNLANGRKEEEQEEDDKN